MGINENAVQAVVSQAFCTKSSKIPLIILGKEFGFAFFSALVSLFDFIFFRSASLLIF